MYIRDNEGTVSTSEISIRMHGILSRDRTWLTCCALHNMLLEVDGLSEKWADGVQSDWETMEDDDGVTNLPNAVRKLLRHGSKTISDLSGMGNGNDYVPSDAAINEREIANEGISDPVLDSDGCIRVRKLSLNNFRQILVMHFNIAFKRCNA